MSFKDKLTSYALGAVVLALGVPLYLGARHKLATPMGATCEASTRCQGASILSPGWCMSGEASSYCTHECNATADCVSGMTCEEVEGTWTTETSGGNHASSRRSAQGTRRVCTKG